MSLCIARRTVALLVSFLVASPVMAGPDCPEGGTDAGSGRAAAHTCFGTGTLSTITGSLSAARGVDFEDMYLIQVTDAPNFSARTDCLGCTNFDTQLWLFQLGVAPNEALGLLANDEILGGAAGPSLLTPIATDGSGAVLNSNGLYLLAISGFDNDPQSAGGAIFNQMSRTEISGPDGPGGGFPHTGGWSGEGAVGMYTIHLTGAGLVEPGTVPATVPGGAIALGALLVSCAIAVFWRRRLAPAR